MEDIKILTEFVQDIDFFKKFKEKHGEKELHKLLRRCYHE